MTMVRLTAFRLGMCVSNEVFVGLMQDGREGRCLFNAVYSLRNARESVQSILFLCLISL